MWPPSSVVPESELLDLSRLVLWPGEAGRTAPAIRGVKAGLLGPEQPQEGEDIVSLLQANFPASQAFPTSCLSFPWFSSKEQSP